MINQAIRATFGAALMRSNVLLVGLVLGLCTGPSKTANATTYGFYINTNPIGITETSFGTADVSVSGTTATIHIQENMDSYFHGIGGLPSSDTRIAELFLYINPTLVPDQLTVQSTSATKIFQGVPLGLNYNVAVAFVQNLTVTSVLSLPKDVTILISGLPDNTSADNILSPNPNLANLPFLSAQNFNFSAGEIYLDLAVFGVDSTGPFVSTTPLYSNNGPPIPPAIPPTPLPAALPLFATGLGALGLLGWRRKRKGAAVAAA